MSRMQLHARVTTPGNTRTCVCAPEKHAATKAPARLCLRTFLACPLAVAVSVWGCQSPFRGGVTGAP